MGCPVLYFHVESVMMTWSAEGSWYDRHTHDFPTHSGIVGLLAAALGYERGDKRIQELSDSIQITCRKNKSGEILTDYQTVQAKFMTGAGVQSEKMDTKVRHIQYLCGASYTVAVTAKGEEVYMESLAEALNDPVFTLYFGKKCCLPSIPLQAKVTYDYESAKDALRHVDNVEPGKIYEYEEPANYADAMYMRNTKALSATDRSYTPNGLKKGRIVGHVSE